MKVPSFSTFWHGPAISAMESACLSSFVQHAEIVYLYAYTKPATLPDGVLWIDAREIVAETLLDKFIVGGAPSLAHFSDYFRLRLFQERDTIWIDTDVVLLKKDFSWPNDKVLIPKEDQKNICNAIMHFPQDNPDLALLVAQAENLIGKEAPYGATGRFLLEKHFGDAALFSNAPDPDIFYPIHYQDFWKVFLPQYREECEVLCQNACTLHLWNNIVVKSGIWKEIGPPAGSYLEKIFSEAGSMRYFRAQYPESTMKIILGNFLGRDGMDLGIVRLSKQMLPALKLTIDRNIRGERRDLFSRHRSASFLQRLVERR